jgi:hypothetical protein
MTMRACNFDDELRAGRRSWLHELEKQTGSKVEHFLIGRRFVAQPRALAMTQFQRGTRPNNATNMRQYRARFHKREKEPVVLRKTLSGILVFALLQCSISTTTFLYASTDNRAEVLVRAAIETIGGEEKLRALKSLEIEAIGHTYLLEQSERPEGPWIVNYQQITEFRDYTGQRLRRVTQDRNIVTNRSSTFIIDGGAAAIQFGDRTFPGFSDQLAEAEESLGLSPERVLLTALDAKDLRVERDSLLQGTNHHVIAFSWRDATVKVYLSAFTSMPTAIEFVRSYPGSAFWRVWGDVRTRVYLSLWTLESGGIRYPRQWEVERNGTPYQTFTVTSLTLNPQLDTQLFSIPADVQKAYEVRARTTELPLGLANKPPVEIAPGVVQIPGNWNTTLVRQLDGVVIIEAPISSGYSDKVIAEAKRRFPDLPIKAVISTSTAWPHIGGVREYVARDVPIYTLDLNKSLLESLVQAPYNANPDLLERKRPKKAKLEIVSSRTNLGSGPNRLELYPMRTETGERGMMVYLPEHKLLYGSDMVQPQRDGSFFMPEYLLELMEAVCREKITIKNVFAMHSGVRPWADVEVAVAKAKA